MLESGLNPKAEGSANMKMDTQQKCHLKLYVYWQTAGSCKALKWHGRIFKLRFYVISNFISEGSSTDEMVTYNLGMQKR